MFPSVSRLNWSGAVLAAWVAGCSLSDSSSTEPETRMVRTDLCARTQCESERDRCQQKCSDCMDVCFEAMMDGVDLDCSKACTINCDGDPPCPSCIPDESACLDASYRFEVAEVPDAEIASACLRAVERDRQCGETNIDDRCDHFARVEGRHAIDAYECIAGEACGSTLGSCLPGPSNLGTEVCRVLAEACGSQCEDAYADTMNRAAGWLRQDVVDQAWACMNVPTCEDKLECLNAWASAVYPPR